MSWCVRVDLLFTAVKEAGIEEGIQMWFQINWFIDLTVIKLNYACSLKCGTVAN